MAELWHAGAIKGLGLGETTDKRFFGTDWHRNNQIHSPRAWAVHRSRPSRCRAGVAA